MNKEIDGENCPHGMRDEFNEIIVCGSFECMDCKYFMYQFNIEIMCSFEDKNNG